LQFSIEGEESERDEQFVRQIGKQYDKEVLVNRLTQKKYAVENKLSIQVAARELRYNWFRKIIASSTNEELETRNGKSYILTAHHADDNLETVVMNFSGELAERINRHG